jgi:hypothetical protein
MAPLHTYYYIMMYPRKNYYCTRYGTGNTDLLVPYLVQLLRQEAMQRVGKKEKLK